MVKVQKTLAERLTAGIENRAIKIVAQYAETSAHPVFRATLGTVAELIGVDPAQIDAHNAARAEKASKESNVSPSPIA